MPTKKRIGARRVARFKAGKELVKRRGSKNRKVAKFKAGKELRARRKTKPKAKKRIHRFR